MRRMRGIATAFSLFSKIPMPSTEWDRHNLRYVLAALPLVGAVIGLVLWGWSALCGTLGFGLWLRAAGLTLLPVAVTGGLHLDGLADTSDALASCAPVEVRREILKDPHTGAFAVIALSSYLLLYFALCTELAAGCQTLWVTGLIPCISRSLAGLLSLHAPCAETGGLLDTLSGSRGKGSVLLLSLQLVLFGGAALWLVGWTGLALLAAGGLSLLRTARIAGRQFGGLSGDLVGYQIQWSELAMLGAAVFAQKVVPLWFS